jgi:hypothetical protein
MANHHQPGQHDTVDNGRRSPDVLVGSHTDVPDDGEDAERPSGAAHAPMRCMACGGAMVLINAIEDLTMPVIGFERHAYMCSACGNIEKRTVFNKQAKEKHEAEIAAALAPPIVPPCNDRETAYSAGFPRTRPS